MRRWDAGEDDRAQGALAARVRGALWRHRSRLRDALAGCSSISAVAKAISEVVGQDAGVWETHLLPCLADVLTNELSATQNLRAWPCRSLWVDMDDAALVEAARALSPNCSRPFTTCSVGRDREEMFGKRSEPIK